MIKLLAIGFLSGVIFVVIGCGKSNPTPDAPKIPSASAPIPASKERKEALAKELMSKGLKIVMRDSNPSVVVLDPFEPNSNTISGDSIKRLKETAEIIKSLSRHASFNINGYTGKTPGQNTEFVTKEILSCGYAKAVKIFLIKECGFDGEHIFVGGMGDGNPTAGDENLSEEKQNRRIEIVIILYNKQ